MNSKEISELLDQTFNTTGRYPQMGIEWRKEISQMYIDECYFSQRVSKTISRDAEKLHKAVIQGDINTIQQINNRYFPEYQRSLMNGRTRDRYIRTNPAKIELYQKSQGVLVAINKIQKRKGIAIQLSFF